MNYNLTNEQLRDYIAKPHHCPWCESDDIEAGGFDADSNYASCSVHCNACNREWEDIYRIVGIYIPEAQEHCYPPEADPGNNERLVAAAPDLLKCLTLALKWLENLRDQGHNLIDAQPYEENAGLELFRRAIAKANG